jgi:hypothetical protein
VAGNAATAKITRLPTAKLTDYMSLLKINGEWKIVNKSLRPSQKDAVKKEIF